MNTAGQIPMNGAAESSSPAAGPVEVRARGSWDGAESPWVLAAVAAAPWPIWSLVARTGVPGPDHVPPWAHGVFSLSAVLALMVVWTHRPDGYRTRRWLSAILGTGLMGELFVNAVTNMGRGTGFSSVEGPVRALGVGLLCVAIYEVAPIVAAAVRLSRSEQRYATLDGIAYASFVALAVAAWVWQPIARPLESASLWRLSPWMAAAIALPWTAARCAPRRALLPRPSPRGGALGGLALVGWLLVGGFAVARAEELQASIRGLRWGVSPPEGLLLVFPLLSLGFSMVAAALLLAWSWQVRSAPHGTVGGVGGEEGLTLTRDGEKDPIWVVVEEGPIPPEGSRVTLLGAEGRAPHLGPFRDGASRWCARRAWPGDSKDLARSLRQRAAAWIAWSAVSGLGVLIALH